LNNSVKAHLQARLEEASELLLTIPDGEDRPERSVGQRITTWLNLLLADWKLLLLGVILAPVAAAVVLLLLPASYVADALVVPTRSRTQVQFVPSITTTTDTGSAASGSSSPPPLTPERRQAYVDLVKSGDVEAQVIAQLTGKVDPGELQAGKLVSHVRGVLMTKSEIIAVEADAASRDTAIALANAWAAQYVSLVNRVYAGTGGDATSVVETQRDQAAAQKDAAQAALVAALQDSRLEDEQLQVADKEHQLSLLQSSYQAGAYAGVGTIDMQMARDDYRLADVRTLDDLAQTLRRLDSTKQTLQTLVNQSQTGTLGAGDAAALTLLKMQLVALTDGLPSQLQFQLPASSTGDSAPDWRALETNIERARAAVARELDSRRAAYESSRAQAIQALQSSLGALRSDVEARAALRKDLTLKRDVAWDAYSALARKVEERRVADATTGRELELADQATTAVAPSRLLPTLGLAALAGFAIASTIALVRSREAAPATRRHEVGRQTDAAPAG
jgi:capsular polysaccharide biosynthesis protein